MEGFENDGIPNHPKLDHFSIEIHAPFCETHIYIYTVHICICIIIYYTYIICRHLLLIAEIHRFDYGAFFFTLRKIPPPPDATGWLTKGPTQTPMERQR